MPISLEDFLNAKEGIHQLIGRGHTCFPVMKVVKPPLFGLATIVVEDNKKVPLVVSLSDTHHLVDPVGQIIPQFDTPVARIEEVPRPLLNP